MVGQATVESAEYIESAAHFSWSETGCVGFDVEYSQNDEEPGRHLEQPNEDFRS